MNGKEQFKQARNSHLSSIMSVYGVDKDLAYQALAVAFENPYDRMSRDYYSPYDEMYGTDTCWYDTDYLDEEEYPTADRDYEDD